MNAKLFINSFHCLKKFAVYFLLISSPAFLYGQTPTYELKVKNVTQTMSNELQFDIYLLHTNPGSSVFEFATGQYYFDFNSNIANGGILAYTIVNSDLPEAFIPRNPLVFLTGGAMQLRLASNPLPSPGEGYIIPDTGSGVKIVRMKLLTSAKSFAELYFNLRWRNGPSNPFTKIYSYIGSDYTEITNQEFHMIDSLPHTLPVELASFTSLVSGNNVRLDWTTSLELNNRGFDIERKRVNEVWKKISFIPGAGNSSIPVNYFYSDKNLSQGKYHYRLKQIDYNGNSEYFLLENEIDILNPEKFYVSNVYPNPFNPSANIDFELPVESFVRIVIYNTAGIEVSEILNSHKSAGFYRHKINSEGLSSGIYFLNLTAVSLNSSMSFQRKFVVIK